jgi:hypothetical protein
LRGRRKIQTKKPKRGGGFNFAGGCNNQMYDSMYEEEKRKQANAQRRSGSRGGMPK